MSYDDVVQRRESADARDGVDVSFGCAVASPVGNPSRCWRARVYATALVLLTGTVSVAPPSHAAGGAAAPLTQQDEQDLAQARQVYEQGVEAYERHRYDEAIEHFKRANRLAPNPAYSFNIGIAYQDAGDVPMALSYYRDYLRQSPAAKDRNAVLARIKGLEAKLVAMGLQQVTILTRPENAAITIDGKRVGLSPWTGELQPGSHEVKVELGGFVSATRSFDLPPAHAIDVSVMLEEQPSEAPLTRAVVTAPIPAGPEPSWYDDVRPVTWAVLGVGVISLGVAAYADVTRGSAQDDLASANSPSEQRTLADTVASRRSWAESFVLLGLGMVASGGALVYSDVVYARNERQQRRATVAGACLYTGCSVSYSLTF